MKLAKETKEKIRKAKLDKIKKSLVKAGKDSDFLDTIMKDSVKPKRMF